MQGYDVVYLASTLGLHAIGLDSSEIAVDKANTYVLFFLLFR
jgi:hypothetical protein